MRSWCPLVEGQFDLDDYIDYLIEFLQFIGPGHAYAGGMPAIGARLCRRRGHGGEQGPVPPGHR